MKRASVDVWRVRRLADMLGTNWNISGATGVTSGSARGLQLMCVSIELSLFASLRSSLPCGDDDTASDDDDAELLAPLL